MNAPETRIIPFREASGYRALELDRLPFPDPVAGLEAHFRACRPFVASLGEDKAGFRYRPEKWSVREVLGHVVDMQIVFLFRALSFSRGDTHSLPGADENRWVEMAGHDGLPLASLQQAYYRSCDLTLAMLSLLPPTALDAEGVANQVHWRVKDIMHYLVGHEDHHFRVLRERYGCDGG